MKCIVMALAVVLPLGVMADDGDDTLRSLLANADLVVLGKIVSEPAGISFEAGVPNYICDFAVEDVLKGNAALAKTVIKVNITRFEMDERDHHPLIMKDARCVLFLKERSRGSTPAWVTADFWLGVQHPFPWFARSLKRVAVEN